MKIKEYSLLDIKENLKRNWKYMLLIFCGCIVLGVVSGLEDTKKLEQVDYSKDDSIVQSIDLAEIEKDEAYFDKVYRKVQKQRNALNAYVQYLKLVRMSGDSIEAVSLFEEKLVEYEQYYEEFENYYIYQTPIIDTENTEKYLSNWIEQRTLNSDVQIDNLRVVALNKEIEFWQRMLSNYEKRTVQERLLIQEDMQEKVNQVVDIFNVATKEFNQLIQLLEGREQYDIVYNRYLLEQYQNDLFISEELFDEDIVKNKIHEAMIYARSVPQIDDKRAARGAYIVFFGLFGSMLALLVGAFWSNNGKIRIGEEPC